ncbi:MAG: choline-sulfatase [Desulfovibrionaceae bacterium]
MDTTVPAQAPNILLIQADQLSANALPAYGHPTVKTPHLNQLAAESALFENAYCNFPLCAPSRMSMLAGRYATDMEVWDNASEAASSQVTLMHYLRAAGYHTCLCGKMHFIGPDQLHGYEERITTDIYPSNYAWTPNWNTGEGDRPTGINLTGVTEAGTCQRSLQIDYDEEVAYFATRKIFDLARYEKSPFFLTVSFTQPHSPFVARQEYWDLYENEQIDLPKVSAIPVEDMDAMSRWIYYAHAGDQIKPTDEEIRTARRAYYAMISSIDEKVGTLMRTLKECDLFENTIIVFTADHGEMLGERGQWYKQLFYEWAVRVPLLIRYPARFFPRRVKECVSLVDLVPTLLDLISAPPAPELLEPFRGQSLTPLLENGTCPHWSNTVISEYTGEGTCAPCRMVRQDSYKYIYTHGHDDILYNLAVDPLEICNIAHEKPQKCAELRALALKDWDPEDILKRILCSQQRRRFINRISGGEPTWAYKVLENDDLRYVRKAGAIQTKSLARYPRIRS